MYESKRTRKYGPAVLTPEIPDTHGLSEEIAEQTKAFLKAGGKIQKVPIGVTGFDPKAKRRHIVLKGTKNPAKPISKAR